MTDELPFYQVSSEDPRKVDIIWNITLICPWDCAICCVDAAHVSARNGNIYVRSQNLRKIEVAPVSEGSGTVYDQALVLRQQQGVELDIERKLKILDNLKGFMPKINFSGGDPLTATENTQVIQAAAERFGRQQIMLTATSAGLACCTFEDIAPFISKLNFSYDGVSHQNRGNRPAGYASSNLKRAVSFASAGVELRAECPLSTRNVHEASLRRLYLDLHENGIDYLLVMRLFPVGRGSFRSEDVPHPDQYRRAIDVLREMEVRLGSPKLQLQCALKFIDRRDWERNPCDLLRKSFGLMADGTLLASPWAIGPTGKPFDHAWVLGNLVRTPLEALLETAKAREYAEHLDDNFGHCKVFSFLNSHRASSLHRIFDKADPLYSSASVSEAAYAEKRRVFSLTPSPRPIRPITCDHVTQV